METVEDVDEELVDEINENLDKKDRISQRTFKRWKANNFDEEPPNCKATGFSFKLNDNSLFLSPLSIASETIISVYKRTFLLIKRKKYLS